MFNINFQEIQHVSFCPTRGAPYCILKRIVAFAIPVNQLNRYVANLVEALEYQIIKLNALEQKPESKVIRNLKGKYCNA
jgi:hypothetical protein